MRKRLSIALIILCATTVSHAQIGTTFAANMFVSIDGGMGIYHHTDNSANGFYGGFAIGKWILNPLAFRIGLDMVAVPSYIQEEPYQSDILFASAEFLWDPIATFCRVRNCALRAYPMIGLGIAMRDSITVPIPTRPDHEVQFMLGLHTAFRVANGWDIFAEYKCQFLPQNFDYSPTNNLMHSIVGGVTYRFTDSPFWRTPFGASKDTRDDWFFGVGLGPNFSSFEPFVTPFQGGFSMMGVAPEIMFGRNFSSFWTIRFEATGLTAHEKYNTDTHEPGQSYTFTMFHADFMANLSHITNFKRGQRWNILPYLGAGAIWRFDAIRFDMAADFGLFARRYLNPDGDFYIDLKYIMMPPRIGGYNNARDQYSVGIPSITFGYIHNLNHSSTRYRLPYDFAD